MNTEPGTLCLKVHLDPDGPRIEICRADPVVWATEEFLEQLRRTGGVGVSYHHTTLWTPDAVRSGDVLTVAGSNRTVVYRVGPYDSTRRMYLLSWPD